MGRRVNHRTIIADVKGNTGLIVVPDSTSVVDSTSIKAILEDPILTELFLLGRLLSMFDDACDLQCLSVGGGR
jgi:hypothetical protein